MTEMVRNQSEIFLVMAGCGLAAGLVQSVFRSFAEIKKLKTFGQAASELCCWIVIGFMISEFFYYCDNGKITFSGIISNATTSFSLLSNVANDNPTYPVPATAIFILLLLLFA